jgi:hypothetical protein
MEYFFFIIFGFSHYEFAAFTLHSPLSSQLVQVCLLLLFFLLGTTAIFF